MREQDACSIAIEVSPVQDRAKAVCICRIAIMHANDLYAVEHHFFIIQHVNTCATYCIEIARRVGKLFVVPSYKISRDSCGELFPWRRKLVRIDSGSIVQIAGDKHGEWS